VFGWRQPGDQRVEPIERQGSVGGVFGIVGRGKFGDRVEPDERRGARAAGGVARGDIVGDAIGPGRQRAVAGEAVEAPPQGEVDVLLQIACSLGIALHRTGEACERRRERLGGLGVEAVARRLG
jgi:hypothetical protein